MNEHFLDGGGRMAEAIRVFDWSSTPLGALDSWPVALKTAVSTMLNSHFPKCIVWGPELVSIHNDAFLGILGEKRALGRSFREVWAEAWDQIGPIVDEALSGRATFIEDFPLVVDRFGSPQEAFFTFCYSPLRDEYGRVLGMLDTVVETTGKVNAERYARLASEELAHRMKNIFAMVSAIAGQTFRSAETIDQAREMLGERLAALAEAQALVARGLGGEADLRDIVEGALKPFAAAVERTRIDGPRIRLDGDQAMTLALAINELVTNAMKYGALSVQEGAVALDWRLREDGEPGFLLDWREAGGPPVTPPSRKGFGTRLIERILADKVGGSATLDYAPAGFGYRLDAKRTHSRGRAGDEA